MNDKIPKKAAPRRGTFKGMPRLESESDCAGDIKINFRYTIKIDGEGECAAQIDENRERSQRGINEKQIDKRTANKFPLHRIRLGAAICTISMQSYLLSPKFFSVFALIGSALLQTSCERRSRLREIPYQLLIC